MEEDDTLDVVQVVVQSEEQYLLAKRSKDQYWEFMGGKVKKDEKLEEATVRELNEETDLKLNSEDLRNFRRGDSYRSSDDERFRLNPVYFELDADKKNAMTVEGLSEEHTKFEWINLTNFDEYETLVQYKALEHLDIVNGRVALSVLEKEGRYLFVKRSSENSSPSRWSFVSGSIESGESPEEAAVRELREETSLKAKAIDRGGYFIGEGEKGFWRLEPVKLSYEAGEVDLNWELSDYEWIKPEKVSEFNTLGDDKAVKKLDLM